MMVLPTPLRNVRKSTSGPSTPRSHRQSGKRVWDSLPSCKDSSISDAEDSPLRKWQRIGSDFEKVEKLAEDTKTAEEAEAEAAAEAARLQVAATLSVSCPVVADVGLPQNATPQNDDQPSEINRSPCFLATRLHESSSSAADRAVERATNLFDQLFDSFNRKQREQRGNTGWGSACEVTEQEAVENDQELVELVRELLPWAGCCSDQEHRVESSGSSYRAVEFRGSSVPEKTQKGGWTTMLACARASGRRGRVRDALCAVFAALGSRREMGWLEAYDTETPVRGYFAHALVDPSSVFRISMFGSAAGLRPVSLLVTNRLPLEEALNDMDSGGPLKGAPKAIDGTTAQYAFQDLVKGGEPNTVKARLPSEELVHDDRIRRLLLTKEPVISISSYVALGPRAVCKTENLSDIIRTELRHLLSDAKQRGQTVVFQLGGGDPQMLAEKVYLKQHFEEYGLRCGYLRWRPSATAAWGRELSWQYRALLGLQLP